MIPVETPYGRMHVSVNENGILTGLLLPNRSPEAVSTAADLPTVARAGFERVLRQLDEYFSGSRREFDLELEPHGTPFERRVWERLLQIPYGATTSYGAIAEEFGMTNGARAVGRANGANPIPIVIPCHRVIGSDGKLTGFGGGLPLKHALLALEAGDLRLIPANDRFDR